MNINKENTTILMEENLNVMEVEKKSIKRKKRGRGRPKKRGPKKKKKYVSKKPKIKNNIKFDYKIVSVSNGRQTGYHGQFYSLEQAYLAFNALKSDNDKIIFRRKIINAGCLKNSRDEYLLLKKNRDGKEVSVKLRNEFGKLIEQYTNTNKWVVYDKCDKYVEETFWVYGKCPKTDRKTFQWIYDNLIVAHTSNQYEIVMILIYKNKVIMKYDDKTFGIVFCKNISDAIRLYDMLKDWCKKNRKVFFIGSYDKISDKRRALEDELIEYTGWTKIKIQRDSTRA